MKRQFEVANEKVSARTTSNIITDGPKIVNSQLDAWNLRLNAVGLEVNVVGAHIAETLPGPLLPPMLRLDAADAATFDDVAVAEAERFAAADAVLRAKLLSMLACMFECRVGAR